MNLRLALAGVCLAALAATAVVAAPKPAPKPAPAAFDPANLRPDQAAFRGLYKELVETNTTLSAGSCTLAAERMAARLKAAGYPAADVEVFSTPEHPKEGGLLAVLHGSDPKAKAILLLAHIDVVEAKREDWTRDPFTLVEEGGYFYARGAADDKAMAASFTDNMIRYKQEGYRPKHDIKLALTCGEETLNAFNGADWLAKNRRAQIDAAFALNEGAGGRLDMQGKRLYLEIQAGEKVPQDYRFESTNPGGHSSRPVKNNAIYHLAGSLTRLMDYEFPVQFNDATRGYFARTAEMRPGEVGDAMRALLKDPTDAKAEAIVSRDPGWHSMLRTTCVATMLDGGHADNALPQRARAVVNCRIFPGVSVESVRQALVQAAGDAQVSVTTLGSESPANAPPPLTPEIMGPLKTLVDEMWPGTPILPTMSTGATDGRYLIAVGIPTYGLSGMFSDPQPNGVHGLNERIAVKSLYEGRDFLYRMVKAYAGGK
jgi:acetylornithine deacetylase/succinyl-diaminopimelate desuccinylase-like protein